MKLSIGFSPCPNDTFIFDALINGKIDTEGLAFEPVLEDVQTLNEWAAQGKLDITKLSFPALFDASKTYSILSSGSALGQGVGPLLISKKNIPLAEVDTLRLAIPGVNTTANFLLSFAFPNAINRIPVLFSEIEAAIINDKVDAGVIIHENRFTYQQKGLVKLMDLGEYWEQQQQLPIPLGCIGIKRTVDVAIQQKVDDLIRASLQYSFRHYPTISGYVKGNAQAMDEAVMRKHIELYVNNYTMDLGEQGRYAIEELYKVYSKEKENGLSLFRE